MHRTINPAILYFGTPVVLVSSLNEDGSPNLSPMSSAWWLGWNCMLGFGKRSKTPANIVRGGECVLNLPSADMAATVDRLARTSRSDPLPPHKVAMGYRHVGDKFGCAGLHAERSIDVAPPRVRECPVQLEARLANTHLIADHIDSDRDKLIALEVTIVRVHIDERLLLPGEADRIDPDRWRPLIMSFCQFYGLGERLRHSTLAEIPESIYRPASRKRIAVNSKPRGHAL